MTDTQVQSTDRQAPLKDRTEQDYSRLDSHRNVTLQEVKAAGTQGPLEIPLQFPSPQVGDKEATDYASQVKDGRLNLDSAYVDDNNINTVAKISSIQELELRNNYKLTDESMHSIAAMPNLKSLSIDSGHITAAGIEALSQSSIQKLTPPIFMESTDADAAAHAFTQINSLKELNLPASRMTDVGMSQLAQSSSLEKLNLSNSFNLTAASIDHLAKMTNLKELDLSYASKLRPADIARLQAALPDCKIKSDLDMKGINASNDDRRQANKLGHNMWLLAGITSEPKNFATEVVTDFSKMSQTQIDLTAKLLETGPYKAIVERDADKHVTSIAYNYNPDSWRNCLEHPFPGVLFLPEAGVQSAKQHLLRGRGNDVTVTFKDGKVALEAKQFFDITGKGFWRGSDTVSTQYKPTIRDNRVPFYRP